LLISELEIRSAQSIINGWALPNLYYNFTGFCRRMKPHKAEHAAHRRF